MSIEDRTEAPPVDVAIDLGRLRRVGQRPGFVEYLGQLWNRRSFIFFDAKARVQSGNDKNILGSAWLILTPMLTGLTFYLIFGLLLNTSRGIENFIGYLIIGVFTFQMSTRSITGGAKSLTGNTSMIRAFQFPRASLPIAINVRELLSSIPVTIVMLLFVLLAPPDEAITWRWFLILPAIFLQFVFNLGVGMLLAPLVLKIPDVGMLLSFVMRIWMYASAVFFSDQRFNQYPVVKTIMDFNPLYLVIKSMRDSLLYATTPSLRDWTVLALFAVGALVAGLLVFWRGEESYGRV
ncbi:ABC transporter permease [Arthrobacter echini]|uniref:Transport permease protein n=1 Tax=Arthrobacter echini TaxID=1529066 RepID=A0A4S5E0W3_9MICC|nr:ABC transporter permease [Arthrobacter echini]THJ64961.1 ABC transporter permease [Arthrobacter echini]